MNNLQQLLPEDLNNNTNKKALEKAIDKAVKHFGGVDMLILNAGIFPKSEPVQDIDGDLWRKAMTVNVEANLLVMQACHALLKLAPRGGRIVVIGSKNVPAPGPGAARRLARLRVASPKPRPSSKTRAPLPWLFPSSLRALGSARGAFRRRERAASSSATRGGPEPGIPFEPG